MNWLCPFRYSFEALTINAMLPSPGFDCSEGGAIPPNCASNTTISEPPCDGSKPPADFVVCNLEVRHVLDRSATSSLSLC